MSDHINLFAEVTIYSPAESKLPDLIRNEFISTVTRPMTHKPVIALDSIADRIG